MIGILKNVDIDKYWISYLSSHINAANRMCHYLGTTAGIVGAIFFFLYINIYAGLVAGIVGYSIALVGHYVFEKNHPHASRPHLSLLCDFLMLYLYVFDRNALEQELERTNR